MPVYVLSPGRHKEAARYTAVTVIDAVDRTELLGQHKDIAGFDIGDYVLDKLASLQEHLPGRAIVTDTRTGNRYMVLGVAYCRDTDNIGVLCGELGQAPTLQWFFSKPEGINCLRLEGQA